MSDPAAHARQIYQAREQQRMNDEPKQNTYLCADCAAKNVMKPGEPVRCKECGHRIMYKPRTTRVVQFEAR